MLEDCHVAGRINSCPNCVSRLCRIGMFVDRFKIALDCFFAIWFVVGNVWIFGGQSAAHDAPNLYRYTQLHILVD